MRVAICLVYWADARLLAHYVLLCVYVSLIGYSFALDAVLCYIKWHNFLLRLIERSLKLLAFYAFFTLYTIYKLI